MADIILTWNANPAAELVTSYKVYQDSVEVGETANATFTITSVSPGVHQYQVSALNAWGESALSAPVSTPLAPSVPGGLSIQINVSVTVP